MGVLLLFTLVLFGAIFARLSIVLFGGKPSRRARSGHECCKLAVFLGSGGHTSEALTLLSALEFARYRPRTYIVGHGDRLSAKKALELEASKSTDSSPHSDAYTVLTIPRARRVHQSLLTTPLSAAWSFVACLYHVTLSPVLSGKAFADVLILTGPGTCVVLVLAVHVNRFLGLPSPRIIYVESFARVKKLSLSGKILYRLVDRFVVQWRDLTTKYEKADYRGWLV